MTAPLLDVELLFQKLFTDDAPPGTTIESDLDTASIDSLPFIAHNAVAVQNSNGNGLWDVTLSIYLYAEAQHAFATASAVYRVIHSWGDSPMAGIVPGVGAVETVDDAGGFSRMTGVLPVDAKHAYGYQGAFTLTVRNDII